MPKETLEYYRYQKRYSRQTYTSPYFEQIRNADFDMLREELPKDCDPSLLHNYFVHFDEDRDQYTYYHFENEDEMMGYKAAVYHDPSIYHNWKKDRKEQEELRKYGNQ